ncbi:hypothetical protein Pfo_027403 [Paulownia fortunei]|nr:hypothetical protein Pfo_027403 [Paulownia fortunei]
MTIGLMEVVLVSARGLRDSDFFGKMDPYVVIQYENQEHTSSTARGQGSRPVWNEEFKFRVEYPAPLGDDPTYKLFLQIMDRDTFTRDDYLGQTTIYLKELFKRGAENGKAELGIQKYRVVLNDLTYHGEIKVGITFIGETDQEE